MMAVGMGQNFGRTVSILALAGGVGALAYLAYRYWGIRKSGISSTAGRGNYFRRIRLRAVCGWGRVFVNESGFEQE